VGFWIIGDSELHRKDNTMSKERNIWEFAEIEMYLRPRKLKWSSCSYGSEDKRELEALKNWFGNRGCPLSDDDDQIRFARVQASEKDLCVGSWVFVHDKGCDIDGDEVVLYCQDSDYCEAEDSWNASEFDWGSENLIAIAKGAMVQ